MANHEPHPSWQRMLDASKALTDTLLSMRYSDGLTPVEALMACMQTAAELAEKCPAELSVQEFSNCGGDMYALILGTGDANGNPLVDLEMKLRARMPAPRPRFARESCPKSEEP